MSGCVLVVFGALSPLGCSDPPIPIGAQHRIEWVEPDGYALLDTRDWGLVPDQRYAPSWIESYAVITGGTSDLCVGRIERGNGDVAWFCADLRAHQWTSDVPYFSDEAALDTFLKDVYGVGRKPRLQRTGR